MPYQSFNNFMKASGDFGGRDNQCYHPAADLVERLRLATGKAKSKKRKALEAEVDAGIVDSLALGRPKARARPARQVLDARGRAVPHDQRQPRPERLRLNAASDARDGERRWPVAGLCGLGIESLVSRMFVHHVSTVCARWAARSLTRRRSPADPFRSVVAASRIDASD